MTFHFIQTESGRTHLRLTFQGQLPFGPNWLKKLFCKTIVRLQILKFWKLNRIDDLINK
jgi:hypothetical protein